MSNFANLNQYVQVTIVNPNNLALLLAAIELPSNCGIGAHIYFLDLEIDFARKIAEGNDVDIVNFDKIYRELNQFIEQSRWYFDCDYEFDGGLRQKCDVQFKFHSNLYDSRLIKFSNGDEHTFGPITLRNAIGEKSKFWTESEEAQARNIDSNILFYLDEKEMLLSEREIEALYFNYHLS